MGDAITDYPERKSGAVITYRLTVTKLDGWRGAGVAKRARLKIEWAQALRGFESRPQLLLDTTLNHRPIAQ